MKITESRLRQIIREELQDASTPKTAAWRKNERVRLMNSAVEELRMAVAEKRGRQLELLDFALDRLQVVATMDQEDGLPADPPLADLIVNLGRIAKDAQYLDPLLTVDAVEGFIEKFRNYISGLEKKP